MQNGPLVEGGLRVCAEECDTCVFRKGNVMHLNAGRVRHMVDSAILNDTAIVCHKTLEGERAVCRGYWDRHSRDTLMCRIGGALGIIEVTP